MLPLMFPCPNLFIYLCGAASSQVIYALRFLQLGTIDRTLNSSFSLPEYFEFIMTGESRRKEAKLPLKTAKKRTGEISPRDFTLQFWIYYAVRMGYTLGVYIFCLAYFRKYGYQEHFGNVNMGASLLFGSPFSFSFNFPFLATSLRDFVRTVCAYFHTAKLTNITVENLHSLAFIPTLRFLSSINPPISPKYTAQNRTPTAHLILAGLSAFFLSSLLHEFLNLLFFMGQGILTFAQGYAQRATGFGISWGTGVVAMCWMGWIPRVVVWMSPLFTRPYALTDYS
ncbi:hypothetical protein BCR33DRAFT_716239 [Rhizoclosmatium globosum]|uniref:Uncharacterized protein n=1 Tax=Rhizoclosmatium globosum TaxID=329046 RepID=A0A1Y2CFI0_9FUNG|nr:hypothetical protein BCR33DRAFT_716239 [Rhizoclosmatium globosum]|eukprot:ORY45564.1 hypothetical protein BCR33DRAFT_716239 [Rhizoclosmatium globosum]